MTPNARPTSDLAADVQLADELEGRPYNAGKPIQGIHPNLTLAAQRLRALVARITDLEAQVRETRAERDQALQDSADLLRNLQAAEAQVAALTQERDEYLARLDEQVAWRQREEVRAQAAEAQVSALTQERDRLQQILTTRTFATTESGAERIDELQIRAEVAEAQLATTRQALAEIDKALENEELFDAAAIVRRVLAATAEEPA